MKYLYLLFFITFYTTSFANTSGYGCKINSGYVYTEYLGTAPAYTGTPAIIYYNSNGPKIPIYWGYGCNDCRGYRCGYINVYGNGSYYDPQTNSTVFFPAENEMTSQNVQCVIAPSLGATPVATDTYVYYDYNKTDKCSTGSPTTGVPLDDYIWIFLSALMIFGVFTIRSTAFKNNFS